MIVARSWLIFLLIAFVKLTGSDRKNKRMKEYRAQAPTYQLYRSEYLPSDSQITTFLVKGELKVFYYASVIENGPLSTTVTTCSSPVYWSMVLVQTNATVNTSDSDKVYDSHFVTLDVTTRNLTALKGLYALRITSKESNTYAHIYISTEAEGPQTLTNAQKLRLQKRQKRRRLTVRWDASLVDPQGTDYCLIVNTKKSYKTLCSAQAERFGVAPPTDWKRPLAASQTVVNWQPTDSETTLYPLIACVGRKRQYTVSNLKQGQIYYFDLFATNNQSNLTYFFGSASTKFDSRVKPVPLRDGKSSFANLKKHDGKIVGKTHGNPLNIFVMPCGALIDLEVVHRGVTVISKERIEKFQHAVLNAPVDGARYSIKVIAVNSNGEDLGKNSGVEVFVVEEIFSLRDCDSVTIAWLPSPAGKSGHYCFVANEGKLRETTDYGLPNQCRLESRLKKSVDFAIKYCKDIGHDYTKNASVITEKISYLKPGKSYIVQVTVKKPEGKSLAYDLLQVHTTPVCHKRKQQFAR
ncbi:hypothetical protein NQ315_001571 [Exocentrus adspersus]|uniref:Protein NDNF n=1 Tax=Exocentrus adspersus TaxID=1586481 RepID=A0AAV8W947_9CUCU|nr:hypothetical protein NQ315_001571 [Exocentrus adspersus]